MTLMKSLAGATAALALMAGVATASARRRVSAMRVP